MSRSFALRLATDSLTSRKNASWKGYQFLEVTYSTGNASSARLGRRRPASSSPWWTICIAIARLARRNDSSASWSRSRKRMPEVIRSAVSSNRRIIAPRTAATRGGNSRVPPEDLRSMSGTTPRGRPCRR